MPDLTPDPQRPANQQRLSAGQDLPRIDWNDRTLRAVNSESLAALRLANSPPVLFQFGRNLVRLRKDDFDVYAEPLNEHSMRHHLDAAATFGTISRDRRGNVIRRDSPPHIDFVRDLLAMASWPTSVFPNLKGIIRCPVFAADGVLITTPGYNARTQLWYHPDPNLVIGPISEKPTAEEANSARAFLLEDFLFDFPFAGPADKANALAFLLTFFVREMIMSPVPLALIEAPAAGTGKSLLAKCLAFPALGRLPAATPPQANDDQWRKLITSLLIGLPTVIWLDNISGTLRSTALETAMTGDVWQERLLVTNNILTTRIYAVFIATANNLTIAGDLPRRIVWVVLDAKLENPEERDATKFKHPDLPAWMVEHRSEIVRAALVLVQAWIAQGKPLGKPIMGSFESWTEVLGGILQVAGVDGFLSDRKQRRRGADDDALQWLSFCEAWWKQFGTNVVGVKELFDLVATYDFLPWVMTAEKEAGRRQKLGHSLTKARNRCFGPYRIVEECSDNSKRKQYRLELTGDSASLPAPGSAEAYPAGLAMQLLSADVDNDEFDLQPEEEDLVIHFCHYWWCVFGTEEIPDEILFDKTSALGLTDKASPYSVQRRQCAKMMRELAGGTFDIFRVEHVADEMRSDGIRIAWYRLQVIQGKTPPLTHAQEERQEVNSPTRHEFTAEDSDRLTAPSNFSVDK